MLLSKLDLFIDIVRASSACRNVATCTLLVWLFYEYLFVIMQLATNGCKLLRTA